jgi:hypothetical protein
VPYSIFVNLKCKNNVSRFEMDLIVRHIFKVFERRLTTFEFINLGDSNAEILYLLSQICGSRISNHYVLGLA